MKQIPMTFARGMGPLPQLLEERGGSHAVKRVFADEGLPIALVNARDQRIPLSKLAGLLERAARIVGDPQLGLDIGLRMPPDEYGLWIRYSFQAATLGEAMSRVSNTLSFHQTGTRLRMVRRGDRQVAWEYWHPSVNSLTFRHHTEGLVPGMILLARSFLGPTWCPSQIEVGYPSPDVASNLEVATGTPWLFDQPALAMVFPSDALLARRPQSVALKSERILSMIDVEAMSRLETPETPAAEIRAVISLRLLDGLTDIDGAAQMIRMSNRTLQRHLDREGLNYRSLLSQVRMDRAVSLVKDTKAPLKRISGDLGYSDPAHFSRAFSAQFGYSPSVLRTSKK